MKLIDMKKALNFDAQKQLAETREQCAELLMSMTDEQLLDLYALCRKLSSIDGGLSFAGCLALLGYMETICYTARKQQQESN